MKPLLLFLLSLSVISATAQSLDYISVRKSNGRVIRNFYAGSTVLLQLTNGSYLQGPLATVRSDSVFVTVYYIRLYRTNWGSVMRDTVSTTNVGLPFSAISRVYLNRKQGFFQRSSGPLLMIGSAGYLALNILNGDLFRPTFTDSKNLRKVGWAAGGFGLGRLLKHVFSSDGFSKKSHNLVYVKLSP